MMSLKLYINQKELYEGNVYSIKFIKSVFRKQQYKD